MYTAPHCLSFAELLCSRNSALNSLNHQRFISHLPSLHVYTQHVCVAVLSTFFSNLQIRCVPLAYSRPPPLAPAAVVPEHVTMLLYKTHATQQCKRSEEGTTRTGAVRSGSSSGGEVGDAPVPRQQQRPSSVGGSGWRVIAVLGLGCTGVRHANEELEGIEGFPQGHAIHQHPAAGRCAV